MTEDDRDRAALAAGEAAALANEPITACPYPVTDPAGRRLAILWTRGYAYGQAILRGNPR